MEGYILLADGLRLDGVLEGPRKSVVGWLTANTAVVGFPEMTTDPAYAGHILAFTYPEIGNVGMAAAFAESARIQVAGLVVRVLSEHTSHYLAEESLRDALARAGVPCLTGIDTRALAVHMRTEGEMPAAIAPAEAEPDRLAPALESAARPSFRPPQAPSMPAGGSGPKVAVLDLGIRRSTLAQLCRCCSPVLYPCDADAATITEGEPAGVIVSDGPCAALPPGQTVETIGKLLGTVPVLGCGLGHVALGMALGCAPTTLRRGHHGANYPVRNLVDGSLEITHQRHSTALDRLSVENAPGVEVLWENVNDCTVEGIRGADGLAVGLQPLLAAPLPGGVNPHIRRFVEGLRGR